MRFPVFAAAPLLASMVLPGAVAGQAAPVPELGPIDQLPRWAVLGASKDRRSLFVAARSQTPTCQGARADVLASGADEIKLRVVFFSPAGVSNPCSQLDVLNPPTVLRVPLGRRLAGQQIAGDDRVSARGVLARLARSSSDDTFTIHRTFPVAGLPTADALASLRGFGIPSRRITVHGPTNGYVTGVTPKLPQSLSSKNVSRFTVQTRAPLVSPAPVGLNDSVQPWSLVGVSESRSSLFVSATSKTPTCRRPRVDVLAAGSQRIELRLVFTDEPGRTPGELCPNLDFAAPPDVVEVPLPVYVAGQQVAGVDRSPARAWGLDAERGRYRTHRIVGLRATDAIPLLRTMGIRKRDIAVRGSRAGYVTNLSPTLPHVVHASRKVTLRTHALPK